jgi:cysteine desulfurase
MFGASFFTGTTTEISKSMRRGSTAPAEPATAALSRLMLPPQLAAMAIYLDNHATTACDPRVVDAMLPWFGELYGNPHSTEHAAGRLAEAAVEQARADIAALIGADPREIVFTSGATEANNLAIKGAARFAGPARAAQIITWATEHKCVLESVRDLADEGFSPLILTVRPDGTPDPERLGEALRTPTLLVSLMSANNETGLLADIPVIAAMAHAAGALFHTDIAQQAGKCQVNVAESRIDLASLSAHKLYGPKGIGALYVRRRPRVRLKPLFSGGGQERGFRSGTLPTPLIVGFGEACRIAALEMAAEQTRIAALRHRLLARLQARIPGLIMNGPADRRLAGNLSLRFPGCTAQALMRACPDLHISTGSACTSADIAPSHVLTAMGLSPAQAAATLRLGIGRFTSPADIDAAAERLATAWAALQTEPAEARDHTPCPL